MNSDKYNVNLQNNIDSVGEWVFRNGLSFNIINLPVKLIASEGKCPINLILGKGGSSVIKHLWNWTSKVIGCKIVIRLTVLLDNASRQSLLVKEIKT